MKTVFDTTESGYILTIGDTSCDVLIRVPAEGNPHSAEPELIAGGTAGNTAAALAHLNMHSKLVTELGDDYYGRYVHKQLELNGVDTEFVYVFGGYPTTQVIILLDENNSPTADWPIADSTLFDLVNPKEITETMISNAAWIHTSGTSVMYANARQLMLRSIDLAQQSGIPLSFDINLRLHGEVETPAGLQALRHAIKNATIVFGSRSEWQYLQPAENAAASARQLINPDNQVAVIRDGPAGSIGIQKATTIHAPSFRVPIRDALGAGDTFDAGFILASLEGRTLAERLRWGNATAALKLMQIGGHRGGPSREQLMGFLESAPEEIG